MRYALTILFALTLIAGCDRGPSVTHYTVRSVQVEVHAYSDRSFILVDGGTIIDSADLTTLGFREATAADRSNYQFQDRYPGSYGVGLDNRADAKIFVRGDDWITYVDGGQKAEFADTDGADDFISSVQIDG